MNEEQPKQPQEPQTQTQSTQAEEPPATHDFKGKAMVNVCGSCQAAGNPGYEKLTLGADQKVLDEMKVVDAQIKKHLRDYTFTHGNCYEHYMAIVRTIPNMTPERQASMQSKAKNISTMPACLLKDDALRHAYMRGLFTKQQIEKAAEEIKQSNHNLTERFKKLAGIIK